MVQKGPSASVSPVTSTSIGISPKIYLTFIFNTFAKLVSNLTAIPSASPKLLILNQEHTSKKLFFVVKFLQNWNYDSFSHRNGTVTTLAKWQHLQYNLSHVKEFFGDVTDRNYYIINFISKNHCFKKT